MQTAHGDISLSLPANTQARLDAATSHGDINSAAPLVRVSRPGPEARYGRRMVGTVGRGEGEVAQISLQTVHGDIDIEMEDAPSAFTGPRTGTNPVQDRQTAQPVDNSAEQPGQDAATAAPAPAYASQIAVLQALSEKQISAEEAEKLLLGLGV